MSGALLTDTGEVFSPRGTARWVVCFALVLAAHAGVGIFLLRHTDAPMVVLEPPAVMLDLEPRPEPVVEPAPEPPPPEPEPVAAEPVPQPEPPPPEPPPPEEVQAPPLEPEPPPPPPPTLELPPPPAPSPPPPPPPRVQPPRPRPVITQPVVQPPRPTPPVPVVAAPAPSPTVSRDAVAAATSSWQGRLQAHLARFKRYPPEAQMRHQEGTPLLRFTMTRSGRVLSFRLERSSGHDVLDREAMGLLERAQPLPALPAEVQRETIELVVPLRFQIR